MKLHGWIDGKVILSHYVIQHASQEIIQNADDASATTISFLLDSRGSPYGKSSLYNDKLAKFQGPALYSFNSARFEQEDWDGLQSLMDSNKKEEPLKVGRFGIGFNSIYHVTGE